MPIVYQKNALILIIQYYSYERLRLKHFSDPLLALTSMLYSLYNIEIKQVYPWSKLNLDLVPRF